MKDINEARRMKLIKKAHALLDEAERCVEIIIEAAKENNKAA